MDVASKLTKSPKSDPPWAYPEKSFPRQAWLFGLAAKATWFVVVVGRMAENAAIAVIAAIAESLHRFSTSCPFVKFVTTVMVVPDKTSTGDSHP